MPLAAYVPPRNKIGTKFVKMSFFAPQLTGLGRLFRVFSSNNRPQKPIYGTIELPQVNADGRIPQKRFLWLGVFMTQKMQTNAEIERLKAEVARGTRVLSLNGLTSIASKAFVLNQLQFASGKTFVIVTDSNKDAEDWEQDLEFFQGPASRVQSLPSFESDVYSGVSPHAETQERRALTLWRLAQSPADFLVLPAKSLLTGGNKKPWRGPQTR
jgi:hypothetical protein